MHVKGTGGVRVDAVGNEKGRCCRDETNTLLVTVVMGCFC